MSKKKEALELFSQGKRPSSPEVKALGLTAKTRYNYFQLWKKSNEQATDNFDEISELKAEKARLTLLTQIEELEAKRERQPSRITNMEKQFVALIEWLKEEHKAMVDTSFIVAAAVGCIRSGVSVEETTKTIGEAPNEASCKERIEDGVKRLESIKEALRWQ